MGFLKKLFGSKENNNQKLPRPLLNDKQLGLTGLEFACYLGWVEDTTKKSIMGKELERRIEMFLIAEKKRGDIKDFNDSDVKSINLLALSASLKDVDKLRETIDDARWPKMEKYMGLKNN